MKTPTIRRDEVPKTTSFDADVDAIVDAVLADPSCAENAKALLTNKLLAPDTVRVVSPKPVVAKVASFEDVDDMWDNVPV